MNSKMRAIYIKGIKKHLLRQYSICPLCNKPFINLKETSIDHIIPLSCGGGDRLDNLQVVHIKCNQLKGNK